MSEESFVQQLQEKAKKQALLEQSSPLPEWARPLASLIGLHYWQFLLCVSFLLAVGVSIVLFPHVYERFR